jgi:hypothetical protein
MLDLVNEIFRIASEGSAPAVMSVSPPLTPAVDDDSRWRDIELCSVFIDSLPHGSDGGVIAFRDSRGAHLDRYDLDFPESGPLLDNGHARDLSDDEWRALTALAQRSGIWAGAKPESQHALDGVGVSVDVRHGRDLRRFFVSNPLPGAVTDLIDTLARMH